MIKSEWTKADALDLQPTCNNLATDCISRQAAIDALRKRIPKHPLESHYEEGIAVGLARAENTIEALKPAAVLPYSIEPDGTLTITVPKGMKVGRVLVQEDGTQWGGLFYAD